VNLTTLYKKIASRQRINRAEARLLYEEMDLLTLGQLANEITREKNGRSVGYIVDRNINHTNVCALSCAFCNFYRKPGDEDAYVLPFEEIDRKIAEMLELGGTGILMQGGHHPDFKVEWFEDLFRHIKESFPTIQIHALSPPEIEHISRISRLSFHDTLKRLKKAGLMSIPGGGGEILVDRVRKKISAGKVLADQWLEIMETAHKLDIPSSATMMFGHVETVDERLIHLERLRQVQDRTGGFFSFIPWTFQREGTELEEQEEIPLVGGHEYLRMLAISRLFLDNFKNIQSSWLTQGVKVGSVALHFGANDLGSVMIEENVISQAGATHRANVETLTSAIESAGYRPRQRSTCYTFLEDVPDNDEQHRQSA